MFTPLLHITLPDGDGDERHFLPITLALEAMIAINKFHIQRSLKRFMKEGIGMPVPPIYMSGVRYKNDRPGEENWRDCYAVMANGFGDCLPLDTLIMRTNGELVPLRQLRTGDTIIGDDGDPTSVDAACVTGVKPIVAFKLANGRTLRCSPNHQLFIDVEGHEVEMRAKSVLVGDFLRQPTMDLSSVRLDHDNHVGNDPREVLAAVGRRMRDGGATSVRVESIREERETLCGDITTSTGRFWLPESDVLVHNCDNLVAWRTAELQAAGIPAQAKIKWQQIPKDLAVRLNLGPARMIPEDGISMVHCVVQHPNGVIEDISKNLGMGGDFTDEL